MWEYIYKVSESGNPVIIITAFFIGIIFILVKTLKVLTSLNTETTKVLTSLSTETTKALTKLTTTMNLRFDENAKERYQIHKKVDDIWKKN